ncbi:monocarboxylate transporter 12-like [Amphiura filiformis]|uniref:monocarboxylate transporter 12-like n=1 Tax=Amphiura filiformis TaxID=82378 RepID=UPI003B218F53
MDSHKRPFTNHGPRTHSRLLRAPDGGWGWFVLLAAHSTLLFREGIAKCLGVFLPTFQDYFNCTTSLIGWISSLCVTFADFTGLVSGPLCQKLGCRPVAMIGGICGGTGLVLGAMVGNMLQLSWCLAIAGIGLGLALTPSLTMVSRYFDKRYSVANGLAYSGSGVGILVLAPLAQVLIVNYGWRGALLIIGGLCFNVTVSGALLRPLVSSVPEEKKRPNGKHYEPLLPNGVDHDDVDDIYHNGNLEYMESQVRQPRRSCCDSTCCSMDNLGMSLFTDISFVSLMVVQFCGRFTYMGWLIYLVPHAIEKGVEPLDAAFLASVAGFTNIIARATHGIFVDRKWLTSLQLLTMGAILGAVALLLDPLLVTYWSLLCSSLAYGLASGVIFPISVVAIKEAVGMERFPNALGWSYGFAGIGRMTAGFLTGWLFDQYGSYNVSFLVLGGIQAFSVLFIAITCLVENRRQKHRARWPHTNHDPRTVSCPPLSYSVCKCFIQLRWKQTRTSQETANELTNQVWKVDTLE